MKLVVQIPCLNEEATLPAVLESIPHKIKGISQIDIVIINDGSTDKTVEVAKEHGVTHFVHHTRNLGLGRSFRDGINRALELDADIIVNTDGDNQYPQAKIADLVQPIIDGQADIVVADRQTHSIEHFSPLKRFLQRTGSQIVNLAAGTDIPDAASGFRAYSREAAIQLNPIARFSYCMETIIQAGNKGLTIASVPVTTNRVTRPSRLFKSTWEHVFKSAAAILRAYTMYRSHVVFTSIGAVFLLSGAIPFVRYLWLVEQHPRGGHLQSLILGSVLLTIAVLSLVLGVLADLTRINRILTEDQLELAKRTYLEACRFRNQQQTASERHARPN